MDLSAEDVVHRVLDRHGRTYSDDAGIRLADEPAPLFQLLVLAQLLSARIAARIAVAAARELIAAGWTSPDRLRDAPRSRVIAALGRAGYRRYDERSATQLRDMAELVLDRYGGDLRRMATEADHDVGRAAGLVQQVKGIGPTGAGVFLREVQHVWPWVRPYLDERPAREPAESGYPRTVTGWRPWSRPTTWRGSPQASCGSRCCPERRTCSTADRRVVGWPPCDRRRLPSRSSGRADRRTTCGCENSGGIP
jgi:hypothetical protein